MNVQLRDGQYEINSSKINYSWYPPGHGNFYEAFHNSGLLDKFIAEGKEVR